MFPCLPIHQETLCFHYVWQWFSVNFQPFDEDCIFAIGRVILKTVVTAVVEISGRTSFKVPCKVRRRTSFC